MNPKETIAAYGDLTDDGYVQVSFTLPVACDDIAREAARALAAKMGLGQIQVATMEAITQNHTFFIVVGSCSHRVDLSQIEVPKLAFYPMKRQEIECFIQDHIGRKLLVIGCNTGCDAHTVGIDAIMNMKGYAGDYGLERYRMLDARNLGSQVSHKELVDFTENLAPDIVLISKVITQRDIHLEDLEDFMKQVKRRNLHKNRLFIVGGPRITHKEMVALGYDAGFGPGTTASRVASFFVQEWKKRGWS